VGDNVVYMNWEWKKGWKKHCCNYQKSDCCALSAFGSFFGNSEETSDWYLVKIATIRG